jgi:osmoprotectant transport system permease protein
VGALDQELGMNLLTYLRQFFDDPEYRSGYDSIGTRLAQHCEYSLLALAVAAAIALPLAVLSGHGGRGDNAVSAVAVVGRAMPSLGLLVLLSVELNLSLTVTMIPLVLLGIPPILLYTHAGIRNVDRGAVDAARGLGMTGLQTVWRVEIPAALPLILAGLRSSAVQIVATATLAAITSFGGLGRYIIDGLSQSDYAEVAGGAVLVVALALIVQVVFVVLRFLVVPAPLRVQARSDG